MNHASNCICSFCAPISQPTRSPIINHLLALDPHSALAHGLERAHRIHMSEINRAALLERCGVRLGVSA